MESPNRAIPSWPAEERPREKLHRNGPSALGPAELLAILIRTGVSGGRTALDLARDLWREGGESWEGLARLGTARIASVPGMGPAKAAAVAAALEVGRRLAASPIAGGRPLTGAEAVHAHFRGRIETFEKELFFALLLDNRNRLIREERVSEGTLTESLVHPREAFRAAVREGAAGVVFVHNHPSGDPAPSADDVALTRRLQEAGKIMGIRMLDHVIVARSGYYSFASILPGLAPD